MESEACPKWKIEYEEQYHKPDYKVLGYSIYVKCEYKSEWIKLYHTMEYHTCLAALNKLKYNLYDLLLKPYILYNELPTMIEIDDQIYKVINISINNSCIMIEQIKRNINYGKYKQGTISCNYVQSFVRFYKKNELLIHNDQIFLNGELLYDRDATLGLCGNINQEFSSLYSDNMNIIHFLFNKYPYVIGCYYEGNYTKNINNLED